MLDKPLRWKRPRRIFVNSMSDLFHEDVPFEYIDKVFDVIRQCKQHVFQILTKRAKRMEQWKLRSHGCLDNVWLGVSAENQKYFNERTPHLLRTEAWIRFVSLEPLLGPIDVSALIKGLDWVIVGGESGPNFRPMQMQWAKDIRDQCKAAGVAFWFKQSAGRRPGTGVELDGRVEQSFPLDVLNGATT